MRPPVMNIGQQEVSPSSHESLSID